MRLKKEDTAGVVIDIQDRLFPHMHERETLLEASSRLIKGLRLLGVPLLHTEQYPRGLGQTLPEIRQLMDGASAVEKMAFSCCDEPDFLDRLLALDKRYVVITGIEAHVCVLQTCLDLLDHQFVPVVIEDCISSRRPSDMVVAVRRMLYEGAIVSSCESVLFELCRVAGDDTFKNISKLVK